MNNMISLILKFLLLGAFLFGAYVLQLYMYQESLIYFNYGYFQIGYQGRTLNLNNPLQRSPSELGLEFEEFNITTRDGYNISSWWIPQKNFTNYPTLVYFHGFEGNIGHRLQKIQEFLVYLKLNIFIIDYRGFGNSNGFPSKIGLKIDSEDSLNFLFKSILPRYHPVFIYGETLGTSLAIHLAITNSTKILGIILENVFTNISSIIDIRYPIARYFKSFFTRNCWDNYEEIEKVNKSIMFIEVANDPIVPSYHTDIIFDKAKKTIYKEIIKKPGKETNHSMENQNFYAKIGDFLKQTIYNN